MWLESGGNPPSWQEEQLGGAEQLNGAEQLSGSEQLSGAEQLSRAEQLSGAEQSVSSDLQWENLAQNLKLEFVWSPHVNGDMGHVLEKWAKGEGLQVHWVGQLCFFTSEKEQLQVPVLVSVMDVALEQNSGSLVFTYGIGTLGTSVGNYFSSIS